MNQRRQDTKNCRYARKLHELCEPDGKGLEATAAMKFVALMLSQQMGSTAQGHGGATVVESAGLNLLVIDSIFVSSMHSKMIEK